MKTGPHRDSPIEPVDDASVSSTPEQVASVDEKTPGQWSVLRNRNFALFFWGELISSAGTQMQVVAVAWQVYELTHSPVALGIIGLLQAIPRLIFSQEGRWRTLHPQTWSEA